MTHVSQTAANLLAIVRATPMRRGDVAKTLEPHRARVAETFESHGLPEQLARRMSRQLLFKCRLTQLEKDGVCEAIAAQLLNEFAELQQRHGLSARQANEILPKLSVEDIDTFVDELRHADRTIARTIFNAAVEAADPLATGRRYLRAYEEVTRQVDRVDHSVARTLANATFTARTPRRKALQHLMRFTELMRQLHDEPAFVRRVARTAFRTNDPITTAERIIGEYHQTIQRLTDLGIDPHLARTMAQSSQFRAAARRSTQTRNDLRLDP